MLGKQLKFQLNHKWVNCNLPLFLLLLNLHSMFFILVLLNGRPLNSKGSHQISNLALAKRLVSIVSSIFFLQI